MIVRLSPKNMLTLSRFHVPGLFLAMLLCIELGRRLRHRAIAAHTDVPGAAAMQSAVFALFGLLLAFTFSGAMGRYDTHRQLIVQEANAIGTAYLRLDLLPADAQPALRQTFRDYTLLREQTLLGNTGAIDPTNQTGSLQKKIWKDSFAAATRPGANSDANKLLIPAIGSMMDITATRKNTFSMHPPAIILILLFSLACASALLAGFGMTGTKPSWLHSIVFAAVISLTIYTTLDIEDPTSGLVTLSGNQAFNDLLQTMH